jgi:hypothetical protein
MGQRLIITEEDKTRIRKLYETATPPSESILIAKLNPFKEQSYFNIPELPREKWETARRPYSSYLKDGDLFTVVSVYDENELEKFVTNEFVTNLQGKTIRIDDKILTFGSNIKIPYVSLNRFDKVLENQSFVNRVAIQSEETFRYEESNIKYFNLIDNTIESSSEYKRYEKTTYYDSPPYSEWQKSLMNTFKKISSEMITKIPDEYFEIRQIKREKTDF